MNFAPINSAYMQSTAHHTFITGPVGSGKTVASIYKMLLIAANQKPAPDGVRYTRGALIRQTLKQLKDTVLQDILQYLGPVLSYKVSDARISIRSGNIHSDWLLYPLEDLNDQRRLLSTQLTFAYVNEFTEIDPELISPIFGRCGRFPFGPMGRASWYGMFGDSNPGIIDSPWWKKLYENRPASWDYYEQPCPIARTPPHGLTPDAENVDNLPPTYYQDLLEDSTDHWAERYVYGSWTYDLAGQAVFAESFVPEFHIFEETNVSRGRLLIVGLDVGRNPAALITQIDEWGAWSILEETYALNMGIERFAAEKLKPLLFQDRYSNCPIVLVADPTARNKSQIGEGSVQSTLKRVGFDCQLASTNAFEPRVRAVEEKLREQSGGKALMRVDRKRCPDLIKALGGLYKFPEDKSGELKERPIKNHPYSDLADALQYAALGTGRHIYGRFLRQRNAMPEQIPAVGGWT